MHRPAWGSWRPQTGFTLIELLVTISIAVILLTVGVPSFQTTLRNNRLATYATDFIAALNLARTEAIRRGRPVVLCKSADGSTCQTGGKNWEMGWIAFVDLNGDNTRQTTGSNLEPIVRVWSALPAGFTLRPNSNFGNYLRYGPDGSANNIGTFAVCFNNDLIGAQAVVVTRLRPRLGQVSDITSCFTSSP